DRGELMPQERDQLRVFGRGHGLCLTCLVVPFKCVRSWTDKGAWSGRHRRSATPTLDDALGRATLLYSRETPAIVLAGGRPTGVARQDNAPALDAGDPPGHHRRSRYRAEGAPRVVRRRARPRDRRGLHER